jgi:glyoxylase-like metal-dependent hydrolase (beta-lactamase superfamily II)
MGVGDAVWTLQNSPPTAGSPLRTTARTTLVLADNPGPMTFEGTNSWLLAEPGDELAVLVDPGPSDGGHLGHLLNAAGQQGVRIASILLTHLHGDHASGAQELAELTGAAIRGAHPSFGAAALTDGEVIRAGRLEIGVIATPGHTADSVSFLLPADRAVLTGDTVLGNGTPAVLPPGGRVGDMLSSLHRLRRLVASTGHVLLPGHGPAVTEPVRELDRKLAARHRRIDEIRRALQAGAITIAEITAIVYEGLDPALRRVAEATIAANLQHLRSTGSAAPGDQCVQRLDP